MHSVPASDGLWRWQEGSHSLKDNGVGFRAGVQLNVAEPDHWIPGLRAHVVYMDFGSVNWTSDAGEDANTAHTMGLNTATHQCYDSNCGDWRKFSSAGGMQAIALTVEPFWNVGGGWTLGVEAGPALFRSTWNVTATAMSNGKFGPCGTQQTFSRTPRWQFGQIVGVSMSKGHFTVRYNYLRAPVDSAVSGSASGDLAGAPQWVPSGIVGQHMVSVNYTF